MPKSNGLSACHVTRRLAHAEPRLREQTWLREQSLLQTTKSVGLACRFFRPSWRHDRAPPAMAATAQLRRSALAPPLPQRLRAAAARGRPVAPRAVEVVGAATRAPRPPADAESGAPAARDGGSRGGARRAQPGDEPAPGAVGRPATAPRAKAAKAPAAAGEQPASARATVSATGWLLQPDGADAAPGACGPPPAGRPRRAATSRTADSQLPRTRRPPARCPLTGARPRCAVRVTPRSGRAAIAAAGEHAADAEGALAHTLHLEARCHPAAACARTSAPHARARADRAARRHRRAKGGCTARTWAAARARLLRITARRCRPRRAYGCGRATPWRCMRSVATSPTP